MQIFSVNVSSLNRCVCTRKQQRANSMLMLLGALIRMFAKSAAICEKFIMPSKQRFSRKYLKKLGELSICISKQQ